MTEKLAKLLPTLHLVCAVLYLAFVVLGPWAKRDDPETREEIVYGAYDSMGGAGWAILATIIGIVLVGLALLRLAGTKRLLPGVGVEQATLVFGAAAIAVCIGYIVGWMSVTPFQGGRGWAPWAAYFPASFIPQFGLLTVAMKEPVQGQKPVPSGLRMVLSVVTALLGAGVVGFPFLAWLSSGSVSLSGVDTGGPRLSYMLFIVGAVILVASLMRLRPRGLAEPGPNLLLSHALLIAGVVVLVLPLGVILSVSMTSLNLNVGIGTWLTLAAAVGLIVVAIVENRARGAVGA